MSLEVRVQDRPLFCPLDGERMKWMGNWGWQRCPVCEAEFDVYGMYEHISIVPRSGSIKYEEAKT